MDVVIKEKKQAKKEMHCLRQNGVSPSEVKLLADRFHRLICQQSKLAKEARQFSVKASDKQMRRQCHHDIHSFPFMSWMMTRRQPPSLPSASNVLLQSVLSHSQNIEPP